MAQPIPGRSSETSHGKDSESRRCCDSAQRAQTPMAVPGQGEGGAAANAAWTQGRPSPGRRAWVQTFTCFIFPSLGWAGGDSVLRLPPPSFPSRTPQKSWLLFPRSFPLHPKKIDSEPGVVLLRSTRGFTARAVSWGWGFSQFSRSVMSDVLQPHGLQHTTLFCPSLAPGDYSNSCPSSQWSHPTVQGVWNFLGPVLLQEKFEVMGRPALHPLDGPVSQVRVTAVYSESEGKYVLEAWRYADPKDAKRREAPGPIWLLF